MIRLLKEEIRSVGSIKEAVKTMSGKIENGVHDYKTHFLVFVIHDIRLLYLHFNFIYLILDK